MNKDAYIYANSRIAALEAGLLSSTQVERMIGAKSADEAFTALNDTFLAPYIAGGSRKDLPRMLRKSVSATKRLITQIVPDEKAFAVLWLRYDFYNLKAIIKGKKAGLSNDEIQEKCFHSGMFTPEKMIRAVEGDAVSDMNQYLGQAYAQAQKAQQVYEIDFAMNRGYFRAARALAQETKEEFIKRYVERIIDLFNLSTQLRLLEMRSHDIDAGLLFMEGGTFRQQEIASQEAILERYRHMGDTALWNEAVTFFTETKNFAVLEKAADDTLVQFVKNYGKSITSIIPVFGYFLAHRNNTQIVKAVIAAKESGMSEVELRRLLRKLYV